MFLFFKKLKWLWRESWLYYLNVIYEQRIVLLKSCLAQEPCNLTRCFFGQNNSYIIEWSVFCCQEKNRTVKWKLFLIRTRNPESVNWWFKTLVFLKYLNHSAWSSTFQVRLRPGLVENTLYFLYWNTNKRKSRFQNSDAAFWSSQEWLEAIVKMLQKINPGKVLVFHSCPRE